MYTSRNLVDKTSITERVKIIIALCGLISTISDIAGISCEHRNEILTEIDFIFFESIS